MGVPQIALKPRKWPALAGHHPWVLARSLEASGPSPPDGSEVDVVAHDGRWVARGIYNGRSYIRVRLYSWRDGESLDDRFWRTRLADAIDLRRVLKYDDPAAAARVVFSEADGLSGLIVDRYGDFLVVQIAALAIERRLDALVQTLAELLRPRGISVRTDPKIRQVEGLSGLQGSVWGEPLPAKLVVHEHGLAYEVDLGEGQKTGLYLDQRENHRAAARYLLDRSVLDVCCYLGGFSLAAARLGGAREVLGIDSSERVVQQARTHAQTNLIDNVRFETGECFETLERLAAAGSKFGGVILDPPRFAGSRKNVDSALRAYHRLNRLAVDLLEPGGILVTCSCSGRVTRHEFLSMLAGVSQRTGREIQVLEHTGAAPDHPVRLSCPETDYLKCVICRIGERG